MLFRALACCCALGALACAGSEADGSVGGSGGQGTGGATACFDGCVADHPAGAVLFEDLADCLICVECYHDCGEVPDCGEPDAGAVGECDGKGVCSDEDPATKDCTSCALAGPCQGVFDACRQSGECLTFGQCIQQCP